MAIGDLLGVGAVAGAAQQAASNAANSSTAEQSNQAQVKSGDPTTFPQAQQATQALQPAEQAANQGLTNAAGIEKDIGAPVGQQVTGSGQQTQTSAQQLQGTTQKAYMDALDATHTATLNAESALQKASAAATIDPQQYLHTMGTDDKVLTSIGMVLSGIGSGLTGQPNLAMDMYNKNTDRAIAAQQAKFQNLIAASAQSQGLLKTAQDRQLISAQAYNMAVISTTTGNDTAIKGAEMNIKSTAAPEVVNQMKYTNAQLRQTATANFTGMYVNTAASGDAKKQNLMAIGAQAVAEHLSPGSTKNFQFQGGNTQQRAFQGGGAPTPQQPSSKNGNGQGLGGEAGRGGWDSMPSSGKDDSFSSDSDTSGTTARDYIGKFNDTVGSGFSSAKDFLSKYLGKGEK